MSKDTTSLWDRDGQWYLRFHIPVPLRSNPALVNKSGKPQKQIVRPLGDSHSAAIRKRDELIVNYRRVFDRLKAGESMTPEQVEVAVSVDLDSALARVQVNARGGGWRIGDDPNWRER